MWMQQSIASVKFATFYYISLLISCLWSLCDGTDCVQQTDRHQKKCLRLKLSHPDREAISAYGICWQENQISRTRCHRKRKLRYDLGSLSCGSLLLHAHLHQDSVHIVAVSVPPDANSKKMHCRNGVMSSAETCLCGLDFNLLCSINSEI